jgi:gas vesicle protein
MFLIRNASNKEADALKSFEELSREQLRRESSLLSRLIGDAKMEDLTRFESDLAQQQSQALFEISTEIEDTEEALKQAEQLTQRLKKHLEQLKSLQRVLSKQH